MIIYDLACQHEHRFEGWFQSSADFDGQCARRLIACPQCGSPVVRRVPSAVHLARAAQPLPVEPAPPPTRKKPNIDLRGGVLAAYRQLTEVLLADCEDVGDRFAEEARRIHYLEVEERSIRGEATAAEYDALRDEGIDVLRLPLLKPGDLH